jgi:aminopeptidase N
MRFTFFVFILLSVSAFGQLQENRFIFTKKDTLRGSLTTPRTCYDVIYYHLDIKIDPETKSIEGSNTIAFDVTEDSKIIQIDLFENMEIDRIRLNDQKKLSFTREYDAVFIEFPKALLKESIFQ